MNVESAFAPINGAQLYYEVSGDGHPLVLVHAGIADRRMWDAQFDAFAQHYRVVRYDMRGYGKSPLVAGDFSHYADLEALLNHLNIERAHLIGCSLGGRTILDFALLYPAKVAKLVTVACAPNGFQFQSVLPPQAEALDDALESGDLTRASELEVQIWVDGPARTPDHVPAAIRDLVRDMNLIALKNETQNLGSDQPLRDTVERLGELRAPTLILWGNLDQPRILAAGEHMASIITGAQKAVMLGTAHLPNMERPDEFNPLVLEFLNKLTN